ncbi:lactonase family protein [Antribacter gilvus]|uniref:lactonase family protein n=1 Tax=Antribacter gilvus TaxID=2304675 RepID=UPI000F77B469|nr:beta-propeller fold lactonase family protein [Antribacter gilvus]
MTSSLHRSLWIGTYPRPGAAPGTGEGVWRADLDLASGTFGQAARAADVASPSFLALHPSGRTLYAVTETQDGALAVLGLGAGGAEAAGPALVGSVTSGGADPCHVVATMDHVWVANYSSGTATVWPVDDDGRLSGTWRTFGHAGSGPVTDRQEGPHAHFVHVQADRVLVSDLGTDELRAYPLNGCGDGAVVATLPPGTGPRHVVELPEGVLVVVGELDCRLHVLVPDGVEGGLLRHAGSVPVTGAMSDDGSPGFPSHLALSPDGSRLYVGVRGPDVLAVLGVDGVVGHPRLTHLADVPLGERVWPRHHAVLDAPEADIVVVAAQGTTPEGTFGLVAVRVDRTTGKGEVTGTLDLPVPAACVLEA